MTFIANLLQKFSHHSSSSVTGSRHNSRLSPPSGSFVFHVPANLSPPRASLSADSRNGVSGASKVLKVLGAENPDEEQQILSIMRASMGRAMDDLYPPSTDESDSEFVYPILDSPPARTSPRVRQLAGNSRPQSPAHPLPLSPESMVARTPQRSNGVSMGSTPLGSPRMQASGSPFQVSEPLAHPLPIPPPMRVAPTTPPVLSPSHNQSRYPTPPQSPYRSPPRSPMRSPALLPRCPRRYTLVKELGRGSFGTVHEAWNTEEGSFFAVKVCKGDQISAETQQEVRLLSKLNHPNIVRYLGTQVVDGDVHIYLELMKYSLQSVLKRIGRFEEDLIRCYTRQILLGLAYLHSKNTMHRDIKCANILVNVEGQVKLADFGVAKQVEVLAASVKGTPFYMAPEILKPSEKDRSYGLPVDIWSLGCTVLEMAEGRPPWSHSAGFGFFFRVCNGEIPSIPDHLSNDAHDFIRSCLRLRPEERHTAFDLLRHPFVEGANSMRMELSHPFSPIEISQPSSPASMQMEYEAHNGSWHRADFLPEHRSRPSVEGLRRNGNLFPSNLRTVCHETVHMLG